MSKDYFAIMYIMGGGVWGRSDDREKAVERCRKEARDFCKAAGLRPSGDTVTVNVFDSTDLDTIVFGDEGVRAVNDEGEAIFHFTTCEHVEVTL